MNLKKYALLNFLTYGIALFAPAFIQAAIPITTQQAIVLTIIFYVIGACLMLFYAPKLTTPLEVEEKKARTSTKRAIVEGIIGIAIVFAAQNIANLLELTFMNQPIVSENTQNILAIIKSNFAFILIVSIAGPIMEELFFRRTLIGLIGNKFDFLIGGLASSILFFLAHGDGHFLIYFMMGFTLALLYRSTGNIITSIIAHCGMNTIVIVVNLILTNFTNINIQ